MQNQITDRLNGFYELTYVNHDGSHINFTHKPTGALCSIIKKRNGFTVWILKGLKQIRYTRQSTDEIIELLRNLDVEKELRF